MEISGVWQAESLPPRSFLGDRLVFNRDGHFVESKSADGRQQAGRWRLEEEDNRLILDFGEKDGALPFHLLTCTNQTLTLTVQVFGGPPPVTYQRQVDDQ